MISSYEIPPGCPVAEGLFPVPQCLVHFPAILHQHCTPYPSCSQRAFWQTGLISSPKHVTCIGLTKFIAESVWSLGLAKQDGIICAISSPPAPAGDWKTFLEPPCTLLPVCSVGFRGSHRRGGIMQRAFGIPFLSCPQVLR